MLLISPLVFACFLLVFTSVKSDETVGTSTASKVEPTTAPQQKVLTTTEPSAERKLIIINHPDDAEFATAWWVDFTTMRIAEIVAIGIQHIFLLLALIFMVLKVKTLDKEVEVDDEDKPLPEFRRIFKELGKAIDDHKVKTKQ